MNVFNTAVIITTAVAVVLIVKLLFGNRITPRGHMLLWVFVVASTLTMPLAQVLPESDFSAKTYLPQSRNTTETVWVEPYENLDARGFGIEEQGNYYTVQKDHVTMQVPFTDKTIDGEFAATVTRADAEILIWLAGALAVLSLMIAGNVKQKRKLKKLPCLENDEMLIELAELKDAAGVHKTAKVEIRTGSDTTFLTHMEGKYVIALEADYSADERRRVLAHELTHLVHGDLILNLISVIFFATFWWNPVIWLAFRRFRRDMEVYCDYDAVRLTGDKKAYAATLVKAAGTERFILGTTSFIGGEKEVSARVKALAAFKKPKTWIAVLAVFVLLTGCLCFALNPKSKDPCTRYFRDMKMESISGVYIERDAGTRFKTDFIRIEDAKQRKSLTKLFRSFNEESFSEGEQPANLNDYDYKLYIDFAGGDELTLLRDEDAGEDVYCIYTWSKEEGESDVGISGKRIHSPKLTELLKEFEDTNLHMSFWVEANRADNIEICITNTEHDNPNPQLSYKKDVRIEHYTGKDYNTYEDGDWETVPEIKDGKAIQGEVEAKGNETSYEGIDISEKYGKLPEGAYRVAVLFTQKLQNGKTIEQERTATFEWIENRLHFVDWDFLLSQPDGSLNDETIVELNQIFETWNKDTLYCYFTSAYSSPDKMNFFEFIRYYPSFDTDKGWTPEMKEKFENSEFWSSYREEGWTIGNFITPVKPYDPAGLNESLQYYADITVDDIRANNTEEKWKEFYVEEIDRYITFTSDAGGGQFIVQKGQKSGDTVTLTGETSMIEGTGFDMRYVDGISVLTLKEKDGRYIIQSLKAK